MPAQDVIQPAAENPYYWAYEGEPVLLLGGSWQDNLFNHPKRLEEHLDLLMAAGGNYVRNVMSHRNEGNVFAYERESDGLFDLDRFNDAYWSRLERFLEMTRERGHCRADRDLGDVGYVRGPSVARWLVTPSVQPR